MLGDMSSKWEVGAFPLAVSFRFDIQFQKCNHRHTSFRASHAPSLTIVIVCCKTSSSQRGERQPSSNTDTKVSNMHSPTAIKPSNQSSSKPKTHLISLNIGGDTFTTTIETLTQGYAANSMLSTLASTTLPTTRDKSGTIFIDRDGARFRVILNFLRSGTVHVVDARVPCPGGGYIALDELEEEARFYSIPALRMAIKEHLSRLELEHFLQSVEPQRRCKCRCRCGAEYSSPQRAENTFRLDADF